MKNTYQFFESFKKKKRFDKYRSIFKFREIRSEKFKSVSNLKEILDSQYGF